LTDPQRLPMGVSPVASVINAGPVVQSAHPNAFIIVKCIK